MKRIVTIALILAIGILISFGSVSFAKKRVELWSYSSGTIYSEVMDEILGAFGREFPDVELNISYVPDLTDQFIIALAAGLAPDIITQPARMVPSFKEAGVFLPVDMDVFENRQALFDRYWIGMRNLMTYEDELYFIPTEVTISGTFANATLLNESGIGELPVTWDDLKQLGAKLTKVSGEGVVERVGVTLPQGGSWPSQIWIALLRQTGSDWIVDDQPNFSNPNSIDVIETYMDLFRSEATLPGDSRSYFRRGDAGFMLAGGYEFGRLRDQSDFEIDSSLFPVLEGGRQAVTGYAHGLFVTNQADDPKLAWEIIDFFTKAEHGSLWMQTSGLLQPHQDPWLFDLIEEEPVFAPFVTGLEHAYPEMTHIHHTEIVEAVRQANDAITHGRSSVTNALLQLDDRLRTLLR